MKIRSLILTLAVVVPWATSANAAKPVRGCTSPESHQFDFWVGHWNVYPKSHPAKHVANSLIEKLYSGCGVRENWMPLKHSGGGSLNAYDPITKHWRQFWIGSDGSSALFTGGLKGKAMVIQGVWPQPGHPNQLWRITYTPLADGSVEQAGEASNDGGKTWKKGFDLIYRKAKKM
jgi:hypothetical protein